MHGSDVCHFASSQCCDINILPKLSQDSKSVVMNRREYLKIALEPKGTLPCKPAFAALILLSRVLVE